MKYDEVWSEYEMKDDEVWSEYEMKYGVSMK
jgi:hypothetical protein